ncbi:MAG: hypothetical protein B1H11_00025 [Desulfobacteraceae bacterium 4484_190.1]|nr:MAG: hypothetical protein B1H11_00025 [Desulfobacteraceae bacterium 4484_190.1]
MRNDRKEDVGFNDVISALEDLIFNSFWDSFEDLPMGIVVVDQKATIRFFNSIAGSFVGIQPMLALGKAIQEIIPKTQIIDSLSTGIPHYEKEELINGRRLKCSSIPIKIQGRVLSVVEFMFDHTEKASIVSQLAELRKKYGFLEALIDASFEELAAVDNRGRLTYISRKSAQNLGFSRDEILGMDISTIDKKCFLKQVAKTGIPHVTKISRPHKKPIPVVVTPIMRHNEVLGAVCRSVFTDMDQARHFLPKMQELDEAQKTEPHLKRISECRFSIDDIIGQSRAIAYVREKALRVAEGDSTILITGESGTGKELFAHAIHMASLRRNGPFIRVNCAGIPEGLLESELFGYDPGSFTGAGKRGKPGKFELAHNGTIFLDELGDMSMGMQAKLLRVVQESEIERVGGTMIYEVDIRIICATNKDLWGMVNRGQFREDLFYRLDVVNIHIPPLRERIEDVPLLIEHFIPIINKCTKNKVKNISQEVLDLFLSYSWPGNIRELRNVLESAINLHTGELIDMQALPSRVKKRMTAQPLCKVIPEDRIAMSHDRTVSEREMIEQALRIKNGNKRQAAIYLNMCRSTLYNKLKQYNIEIPPV